MRVPVSYFFEALPTDGISEFPDTQQERLDLVVNTTPDVVALSKLWAKVASRSTRRAVLGLVRALANEDN